MTERALPVTILEPAGIDPELLDHSLSLRFDLGQFDPRITFTRNSSATYFGSDGLLKTAAANAPRIDHNPTTGECLGLLIEEQRTNLLLRSQEFISPWIIQGATVVNNAAAALDGSQTAALLVANLGYVYNENSASVLSQFMTLTGGTTYTWSIYAKAAGVGYLAIRNNWTGSITIYNLTDELTTANKQFIGNGWYRCFVTYTPSSTSTNGFSWRPFVSGGTADGVGGVLLWGAQVEAGAFPTSYIKTEAAQVTRAADIASMTGENFSSWYRADEGTLFADVASYRGPVPRIVTLHGGSAANQIWMRQAVSDSFVGYVSNAFQWQINIASAAGRIAGAYRVNDIAASGNGGSVQTDSSATLPTLDRMIVGASWDGGVPLNGHIRKIAYYPKRISNAKLQALTQ